jgi:hypothetical protein
MRKAGIPGRKRNDVYGTSGQPVQKSRRALPSPVQQRGFVQGFRIEPFVENILQGACSHTDLPGVVDNIQRPTPN